MATNTPSISVGNPNVRTMLEKLLDKFADKFKENPWEYFLEYIAADNDGKYFLEFGNKLEWLINDKKFRNSVNLIYDQKLLRSDYFDHLGDIYYNKYLNKSIPIFESLPNLSSLKPFKVLDKSVGTGRKLMDIHRMFPNVLLFGTERNLELYRIALTNFAIHKIPGYLLYVDSDNEKYLWKYANKWHSHLNDLKEK